MPARERPVLGTHRFCKHLPLVNLGNFCNTRPQYQFFLRFILIPMFSVIALRRGAHGTAALAPAGSSLWRTPRWISSSICAQKRDAGIGTTATACSARKPTQPSTNECAKPFNWRDRAVWVRAGTNTNWCLFGCSLGEFGTLGAFDLAGIDAASGVGCVNLQHPYFIFRPSPLSS